MRSFAVLPLLAVFLVSLCGSQVPPPPSDVSGTVYFDANLNGIRDSCDKPAPGRKAVALDEDGEVASTGTDRDGLFRLEVPQGSALISVDAPEGQLWPTSTRTADGRNGVAIDVGSKDVSGIELGLVTKSPVSEEAIVLAGIIFNDRDRDGDADLDECGIKDAQGVVGEHSSVYPALGPMASGDFAYALDVVPDEVQLYLPCFPNACPGWIPTRPDSLNCLSATPRRAGERFYEVRAGFTLSGYTGSVTGTLFHDVNANGVRDHGEDGVEYAPLEVVSDIEKCPYFPVGTQTGADGAFAILNVPPGDHRIRHVAHISTVPDHLVVIDQHGVPVTVGSEVTTVDIPLLIEPGGFVHAYPFDDVNGNGVRDAGEAILEFVHLCAASTTQALLGYPGSEACSAGRFTKRTETGAHIIGPLRTGDYSINVPLDGLPTPASHSPIPTVAVIGGGATAVEIPMNVLTPEEQLVHGHPDVIPVEIDICYSDPAFARRAFDEGYDGDDPIYWSRNIGEGEAREMDNEDIFLTLSPARYVFFQIAGIDRNAPGVRECAYDGGIGVARPDFWIAGYEVVAAMRVGWTFEVVLRDTFGIGVEAISLPITYDLGDFPSEPWWVVFADESYTPIARCSSGGCD